MTSPVPDLLDAIVARYPGVLELKRDTGGWRLTVNDREIGIKGSFQSSQRHVISGMAMAWERFRDGFIHGPRRCTCGRLYAEHAWDAAGKRRGACPPPDEHHRYEPEDLAVLAGQETHSA